MIGRLMALGAGVAAAVAGAGAAVWAKRKGEEDAALEQEILETVEEQAQAGPADDVSAVSKPAGDGAAGDTGGDDLTDLKGIGAVSAERLNGIGVTTFAQIADWSDEDLEAASAQIKVSVERIQREDWVGQARATLED